MNVTLAMPDDLVADSRRYAAEHGTTLNALIRELLDGLRTKRQETAERKRAADEFLATIRKCASEHPVGWKFNRDELYVRNAERGW